VSSSESTCSETLYKTTLAFELSEQVGRRKLGRKERTRCIPYTSYQLVESFSLQSSASHHHRLTLLAAVTRKIMEDGNIPFGDPDQTPNSDPLA